MFNQDSDQRFKLIYEQGITPSHKIIVDTITGVNYLFIDDGNAGGLTVLLNKDGKPVITPIEK